MSKLSQIPFLLSFDEAPYYDHNIFPNHMYRRLHPRHHDQLDLHTLGLIARLGAHAHHRHRNGEMTPLASACKDLFEVHLDVGLFQPKELSVKVIDGNVVIEGKHEEREDDHGHISRHFVRRYKLPKNYNPDQIISELTADGVLIVRAPKYPTDTEEGKEYVVPIQHVGPSQFFLNNKTADGSNDKENSSSEKK